MTTAIRRDHHVSRSSLAHPLAVSDTERVRLAERNLDQLLEWGSRIDGKSSLVLGVTTGMIGVLATLAPMKGWTVALQLSTGVTLGVLAASLLCMYLGTYPQTRDPGQSLFFFGSIARRQLPVYREAFETLGPGEYLEDLLGLCHRNAQIVCHKFAHLKWAYRLMFVGVIPWGLTLYLFKTAA